MAKIKVWGEEEPEDVKIEQERKDQVKHIKQKKIKKEREPISIDIPWNLILCIPLVLILCFAMVSIVPLINDMDFLMSDGGDAYYTIQIYVPNCEDGWLFLERHNVSGNYLVDNNLAVQTIFSSELNPSSDYGAWDRYVNIETGSPMRSSNVCVIILEET